MYIFRAYARRVQSVHRSRARTAKEGSVNLKAPITLAIDVYFDFFIFIRVFSNIFNLFRKIIM
jgi:hypothetical protein